MMTQILLISNFYSKIFSPVLAAAAAGQEQARDPIELILWGLVCVCLLFGVFIIWSMRQKIIAKDRGLESLSKKMAEERKKLDERFAASEEQSERHEKQRQEELSARDLKIQHLEETVEESQITIKQLRELLETADSGDLLPICSSCKDVRDADGYWRSIEEYLNNLSDSELSHSLCPDCMKELYPELYEGEAKPFILSWKPNKPTKRSLPSQK